MNELEHVNYDVENKRYNHKIHVEVCNMNSKKRVEEEFVVEHSVLKNLNLSTASYSAPLKQNNLILIDNYFIDFWGAILEPLDFQIYMMLRRLSRGEDFTIVGIAEIEKRVGKSKNTVKESLRRLENHLFILVFQRVLKSSEDSQGNATASVYIKIRQDIPMLSVEQVQTLSPYMQKAHSIFVEETNAMATDSTEIIVQPTKAKLLKDLILEHGTPTGRAKKEIDKIVDDVGLKEVVESIYKVDDNLDKLLKEKLKDIIPKPSYDVFINDSVFLVDGECLFVFTKNDVSALAINDDNSSVSKKIGSVLRDVSQYLGWDVDGFMAKQFSSYYTGVMLKRSLSNL